MPDRPRPTDKTALLTLGRLPVALEIARALHAHGWRVVVAEPLAWHLCRLSNAVARCHVVAAPTADAARHAEGLLGVVREERASLVVPVSEETLFVAALHGRLPERVALACPSRRALLELHDKWRFATRARGLGLAVPETALASSEDGVRLAASGPHVIKPRLSCAGVGVTLVDAGAPLPEAVRRDAFVVQRRLPGPGCCAFAFARDGTVATLVVYRSLFEAGSVSVRFERVETPAAVRELVAALVRATLWHGMLALDLMLDGAGRWHAIECNPRATSALHLLSPETIVDGLLGGLPRSAGRRRATDRGPADRGPADRGPADRGPVGRGASGHVPDGASGGKAGKGSDRAHDGAGDGAHGGARAGAYEGAGVAASDGAYGGASVGASVGAYDGASVVASDGAYGGARAESGVSPLGTRRQEFWSALAATQGRLLRGRFRREDWRQLFTTPDVDWSRRDRKPFLLMVFANGPLLWRAVRARRPITEVTMRDMGWHGERADAPASDGPYVQRATGDDRP